MLGFILFLADIIVHVLHPELDQVFQPKGNEAETFGAFPSDYFKDLYPHFATEADREGERWDEHGAEDQPRHRLTFHEGVPFARLVVEARVDCQDDDTEGQLLHGVERGVIVGLVSPLDHEEDHEDENGSQRLHARADRAQEHDHHDEERLAPEEPDFPEKEPVIVARSQEAKPNLEPPKQVFMLLPRREFFDFEQGRHIRVQLPQSEEWDSEHPCDSARQRHCQNHEEMRACVALFLQIVVEAAHTLNHNTVCRLGNDRYDSGVKKEENDDGCCGAFIVSLLLQYVLAPAVNRPEQHTDGKYEEGHAREEDQSHVIQPEGRLGVGEHVHYDAIYGEHLAWSVSDSLLRREYSLYDVGPLEVNL